LVPDFRRGPPVIEIPKTKCSVLGPVTYSPVLSILQVFIVLAFVACAADAIGQEKPPLKLLRRIAMPQVAIKGPGPRNFDALTADVKSNRLFVAAQWHGSVEVYDMKSGKLLHSIPGIGRPLDILYVGDLKRLYVTDGTGTPTLGVGKSGAVRIYDDKTYKEIRKIDLKSDTDSIAYDPATRLLYVKNGGEDANDAYSLITILKTIGDKVGEIKIDSDTIGDVVLESDGPRLFIPETDKKRKEKTIRVFDRHTREQLASWPDPHSTHDGVMDLDEKNHRLFAGEPEGLVTVFDTDTGKEITTLPIGTGMDGLEYDEGSKRIYVTCGDDGQIYVYGQHDPDHYQLLGKVPSGPKARSGTLVPELRRFFTAVPEHDGMPAELLEYEVQ
jgi:WD40 repeat protein